MNSVKKRCRLKFNPIIQWLENQDIAQKMKDPHPTYKQIRKLQNATMPLRLDFFNKLIC